jgi:glycosyltransferase involved in cell wall biosynthesis
MKKRLLVTTTTLPRWEGDPEPRFVLDLARSLTDEFDVTVLAPASPGAALEENLSGVRIRRYRYAPARSMETLTAPGAIMPNIRAKPWRLLLVPLLFLGLARATRKTMRETAIDLVHCHWLIPQGLVQAFFFSRTQDPPFVLTSHGGDAHSFSSRFIWKAMRIAVCRSAGLSAVSAEVLSRIDSKTGGIPARLPSRVITMGADVAVFSPDRRREDFFARWVGNDPVILSVGRLAEKKGLSFLLRATATEPLASTSAHVVIVGDGPLRETLQREAADLGVSDRVHFLGSMAHDDLAAAYASADVFCLPSIIASDGDAEGFPTVLLEAAASGVPLVSTVSHAHTGFVISGETGLTAPQRDPTALSEALATLLEDEPLRRKLSAASIEAVREYDWRAVSQKFRRMYRSAIDSKAHSHS